MQGQEIELEELLAKKFPGAKPVNNPPTLGTLNGFGFGMYGRRNQDSDTGAYVATHCFCALWIPLIPFRSYVVADAPEGGWYFLAKTGLSSFARGWNFLLLAVVLGLIGQGFWNNYQRSPAVQSKRAVAKGNAALKAGDYLGAAGEFSKVVEEDWPGAEKARVALRDALTTALNSGDVDSVEGALAHVARLPNYVNRPDALVPGAYSDGLTFAKNHASKNAQEARRILSVLKRLASRRKNDAGLEQLAKLDEEFLNLAVEQNPDDPKPAVELAELHESRGNIDDCLRLLEPHRNKLGDGEGARILGSALMEGGDYEAAVGFLQAYVTPRLKAMTEAEADLQQKTEFVYNSIFNTLRDGDGPASFYRKLDGASEAEQGEMVDQYVAGRLQKDPRYTAALERVKKANAVVPVAFDLGVAQLNRAQAQSDPDARKQGLEAAEKTFLSLEGSAGETMEYRLFMGKVSYWLGKEEEGKALFDQLLAADRGFQVLMLVGHNLRDLGDGEAAKALFEEAYEKAADDEERNSAAHIRAISEADIEKRITWLEKCDSNDPNTKVELHSSRASLAKDAGDFAKAISELKQAVRGYDQMPPSTSSLNNGALVNVRLFSLTGAPGDYAKGVRMMGEALKLSPDDPIVVMNTASMLFEGAVIEILAEKLDLKALNGETDASMLSLFYDDEAGKQALVRRLYALEPAKRAKTLIDRALIMAPKSHSAYTVARQIFQLEDDAAARSKLLGRLRQAELDLTAFETGIQELRSGQMDQERLEKAKRGRERYSQMAEGLPAESLTAAYARSQALESILSLAAKGQEIDVGPVVSAVEQLVAQQPCLLARSLLSQAHLAAADQRLKQSNPAYRALTEQTWREWTPRIRITWALWQADLGEAVKADPNVQKALESTLSMLQRFPKSHDFTDWALIAKLKPELGESIRSKAQQNQSGAADWSEFTHLMAPTSSGAIWAEYWRLLSLKKDAEAQNLLTEGRKRGAVLPEF